jgi:shikimate kinase
VSDSEQHLVLVGLMGAGKSTVGRACAARLGRDFVDTDDVVVRLAGMTIDELFASEGEPGFRARERTVVADVSASPTPLVIGCGGGTVLDPANRKVLGERGFVVWLQASVDVLATRVGTGDDRPLLRGDPRAALARLLALREPAYNAVADAKVVTDDRAIDEVATAVLDAYCEIAR